LYFYVFVFLRSINYLYIYNPNTTDWLIAVSQKLRNVRTWNLEYSFFSYFHCAIRKDFQKCCGLVVSGVINNYNYSPPIRIVRHGGPRLQLPATYPFCLSSSGRRVDKNNCSDKFIDKNNLMHHAYTNTPILL